MIKNIRRAIFVTSVAAIFFTQSTAQTKRFDISYDKEGQKVLTGMLSRSDISSDTAFKWFAENMKYGTADAAAVAAFQKHAGKFKVIVFAGTWCDDSHNLLPVFYRLADKSGFPDSSITLIGVDRDKKTVNDLHTTFHIVDVPTFIVMKDGKEVGRIVEYGKYGQVDKELGEIANTIE